MKWHSNERANQPVVQEEENKHKPYADGPLYTKDSKGQYQLFPPVSMYQQVLTFLKDLRLSDFD